MIGLAGTDAKCRWVENLGADVCLNYKSPSFKQDLTKETEGFVEIYFGGLFFTSIRIQVPGANLLPSRQRWGRNIRFHVDQVGKVWTCGGLVIASSCIL